MKKQLSMNRVKWVVTTSQHTTSTELLNKKTPIKTKHYFNTFYLNYVIL